VETKIISDLEGDRLNISSPSYSNGPTMWNI